MVCMCVRNVGVSAKVVRGLFLATLCYTAATWLLLHGILVDVYTCQFGVYKDTTTVLTYDNLLAGTDIQLALRWNLVEATTT